MYLADSGNQMLVIVAGGAEPLAWGDMRLSKASPDFARHQKQTSASLNLVPPSPSVSITSICVLRLALFKTRGLPDGLMASGGADNNRGFTLPF